MTRKKLRAWSTVWRVQARDGVYWAKQNCPSQSFEGDESALWGALPHGLRLARLSRHEAWWRVMSAMTDEELAERGVAAPHWLSKVSDPPPDVVAPT
jgi:hypothetical protein